MQVYIEAGALPSGATTPGVELPGRSTPSGGASRTVIACELLSHSHTPGGVSRRRGKLPHRSACRSVRAGEARHRESAFPGVSLCTFRRKQHPETQLCIGKSISSVGYQPENAPRAVRFLLFGSVPRHNVRDDPCPPYGSGPIAGRISVWDAGYERIGTLALRSALRRAATALVWDGRLAA